MNIVRPALFLAIAVASVWAFVPQALRAQSSAATAAASASPAAASPSAASPIVDTKNFAYAPATLTVATGTKVIFKNSDTTAHTVTAADKSFDSGNMDTGKSWSHVFAKPGTYAYLCTYHTYMQGTVIVK